MKRSISRTFFTMLAIVPILFAASVMVADAQLLTPFPSKGGMRTAQQQAKSSLGADAQLVFVGTFGNIEYQGQSIRFDPEDGSATLWGYTFYSPSSMQSKTIAVVRIITAYVPFDFADTAAQIPLSTAPLDTTHAYFNSRQMVDRLAMDTAFQRHHTKYPSYSPTFVTLSNAGIDNPGTLPGDFPLNQPVWTAFWGGGGDSSMICFVADSTGESFCQRFDIPSSVEGGAAAVSVAVVSCSPNPASDGLTLVVTPPDYEVAHGMFAVAIFNERGEMVMDLSDKARNATSGIIEIDASSLPTGIYFCRAAGRGWNAEQRLVINR